MKMISSYEEKSTDIHAVYLHIPFCKQKCLYCDFASQAGCSVAVMQAYAEAVVHEIYAGAGQVNGIAENATIYFGGGTPSVMPLEFLQKIVTALKSCGFWKSPAEATIEINPGTISKEGLRDLLTMGFDRVSFGVQSLDDVELKNIGRIHNGTEALDAIASAHEAGFKRISADLMYGLPGQTVSSLAGNLSLMSKTSVEHISVYGLTLEEGTPLAKLVERGISKLPEEDVENDMYDYVQKYLKESGFARYEISNYAKSGGQSLHNSVYWNYLPYLGFGASACSFFGNRRRTGVPDTDRYIAAALGRNFLYEEEKISADTAASEYMFMGLRKCEGIDIEECFERFGVDVRTKYAADIENFIEQGLLDFAGDGRILRLTEKGMSLGNTVFQLFV